MSRAKLFVMTAIILLIATSLFAEGKSEVWDGTTITVAGGRGMAEQLEPEFPDITFEYVDIDPGSGTRDAMASLVLAGDAPDILINFTGRSGGYLVPEYALPLNIDESVWDQAILDTFKRDGVLYGLPFSLPVQGMAINLDVVTDIAGYDVPEGPWTTNDFMQLLYDVKNSDYEGYPTYLYAGISNADYFWLNWFSAFGVKLFADDYSRSAVNDTDGLVKCFEFLQNIVKEGYSPKTSATNTVKEVLPGFRAGKIAVTGYRPNWIPPHQQAAINNGEIDHAFKYTVKPFPVYPGIKWPAPIPGIGTCVLGHKTDNGAKAKAITDIIVYIADIAQMSASGDILTRNDIQKSEPADPITQKIIDYTAIGGFMDPGYTQEWYVETREAALPILRDLYNMLITPSEAAKQYEEVINKILAEYNVGG